MKNILCYGDSNTWGYIPGTLNLETGYKERYSTNQRWTMLLQQHLGQQYRIIEEGLGARTTDIDDPNKPGRNGLSFLKICLESHAPLSLVILMLGTNDLNNKFSRELVDTVNGIEKLINCIKETNCGSDMLSASEVLIISPPHPCHEMGFDGQFLGSISRSKKLVDLYQNIVKINGCYFLNAAELIHPSEIDGIHLDLNGHKALSKMISAKILEMKLS